MWGRKWVLWLRARQGGRNRVCFNELPCSGAASWKRYDGPQIIRGTVMALASVYTFVLTASAMSAELRKANGYLAAGSAAIVAAVMTNFSSAKLFAEEASLRFTMFWLLLVVALSGVSWFASMFVAARATGLQAIADLPKYGHEFLPGEAESMAALSMRALFPFLRPLGRWQARKLAGGIDEVAVLTLRWAQIQGLATMAQFLFVAIAAGVLFEGLKFG